MTSNPSSSSQTPRRIRSRLASKPQVQDPSIAAQEQGLELDDDLIRNEGNEEISFENNGSDSDSGNAEKKDRRNSSCKRGRAFDISGGDTGRKDLDSNSLAKEESSSREKERKEANFSKVAKRKKRRITRVLEKEGIDKNRIIRKDDLGFNSGERGAGVSPESPSNPFSGDGENKESLNLRPRARIPKARNKGVDLDFEGIHKDEGEVQWVGEPEMNHPVTEDKGKRPLIEEASLSIGINVKKSSAEEDSINDVQQGKGIQIYSKEENGKGILVGNNQFLTGDGGEKLGASIDDVKCVDEEVLVAATSLLELKKDAKLFISREEERKRIAQQKKDDNLRLAREYASHFAYFDPSKDIYGVSKPVPGTEVLIAEAAPEDDCPGPFSTALRIVEERARKSSAQSGSSALDQGKVAPVIEWVPLQDRDSKCSNPWVLPSLQEICLSVLLKHAEEITSLEGVPDILRSRLSHLLCDSRKMDYHMLGLIVGDSPLEICIKDCSWMTEEQFLKIFGGCDTERLLELKLDLCGHCMPDYILSDTLARSPNCLPALITTSLRGAHRLSDNGLRALVSSAPSLSSINLSQCSFLTSAGISILAENLRPVLRELYIDDCQNVDVMSILPALKNLKHLEVLSVRGIQNVCDEFVCELIPVCGPNMKEIAFTNCGKLTDTSLKIISKNCSGLCAIDLGNLKNLTDVALEQLANGCRSLKVLKLCCNAFSDQGIAAFLEVSGESLTELSLNKVKEVANNTAISLATCCSKMLLSLDLSWCRKLMDEALGLIVDQSSLLRFLRLFGCSQVTKKFLDGHSNPLVKIIGLKMSPLLEHLHMPHTLESALRY